MQLGKINVFPVLHTIFFLLAGQKVDLFALHGAIKSTLWPASRKNNMHYKGRNTADATRVTADLASLGRLYNSLILEIKN